MPDRATALAMWAQGVNAELIAERCGYSCAKAVRKTVSLARQHGADTRLDSRRVRQNKWTPEDLEFVRTSVLAGVSHAVIAAKLGRTRNATIGAAHRLGLAVPKPKHTDTPRPSAIVDIARFRAQRLSNNGKASARNGMAIWHRKRREAITQARAKQMPPEQRQAVFRDATGYDANADGIRAYLDAIDQRKAARGR